MSRKTPAQKFFIRGLQRYWRCTRALTLGAQGCILDDANRCLLVRHTYRPGWHFPGGGVEKNESVEKALNRELEEEAGIFIKDRPQLFGLYDHAPEFPGDHIVLFVVRSWHRPEIPKPNREIAETGFFEFNALPDTVNPGTKRRLHEILTSSPPAEVW